MIIGCLFFCPMPEPIVEAVFFFSVSLSPSLSSHFCSTFDNQFGVNNLNCIFIWFWVSHVRTWILRLPTPHTCSCINSCMKWMNEWMDDLVSFRFASSMPFVYFRRTEPEYAYPLWDYKMFFVFERPSSADFHMCTNHFTDLQLGCVVQHALESSIRKNEWKPEAFGKWHEWRNGGRGHNCRIGNLLGMLRKLYKVDLTKPAESVARFRPSASAPMQTF